MLLQLRCWNRGLSHLEAILVSPKGHHLSLDLTKPVTSSFWGGFSSSSFWISRFLSLPLFHPLSRAISQVDPCILNVIMCRSAAGISTTKWYPRFLRGSTERGASYRWMFLLRTRVAQWNHMSWASTCICRLTLSSNKGWNLIPPLILPIEDSPAHSPYLAFLKAIKIPRRFPMRNTSSDADSYPHLGGMV